MTQLAGTCQAYPCLRAAGRTGTASRRACGGLCHRRGARARTCFLFFFDSLARVTPPVLLKATVSSDAAYIVAVDVFLIKTLAVTRRVTLAGAFGDGTSDFRWQV